jgi:hypothetical protein
MKGHRQQMKGPGIPEWWAAIPEGEKALLHAIARMLRSAKRSELQEVARAAAKWERGIGCFVKVRLKHQPTVHSPQSTVRGPRSA